MADDSWKFPTSFRRLKSEEWDLVTDIFQDTLPYHWRVLVTNGLGGGGAPFTIPTSVLGINPLDPAGLVSSYIGSFINAGYLMNVGSFYDQNMAGSDEGGALLAHEMTHVWQGKNSTFALTYVLSSAIHQCAGMIAANGSLNGRNAAYNFTPGKPWTDYNPEQQASIVESWYASGKPESGDLWPYIRDDIRQGND